MPKFKKFCRLPKQRLLYTLILWFTGWCLILPSLRFKVFFFHLEPYTLDFFLSVQLCCLTWSFYGLISLLQWSVALLVEHLILVEMFCAWTHGKLIPDHIFTVFTLVLRYSNFSPFFGGLFVCLCRHLCRGRRASYTTWTLKIRFVMSINFALPYTQNGNMGNDFCIFLYQILM